MAVFDERLKTAMKNKNVSQSELCQLTSIPKSAMSQYVSGKFIPRQDRLMEMARLLGVEPGWLLGYDTDGELSERERELIVAYRLDTEFRGRVDELLDGRVVFRAAKSNDGKTALTEERLNDCRLERIAAAPETDEDF